MFILLQIAVVGVCATL